jgi:hypothetical protein
MVTVPTFSTVILTLGFPSLSPRSASEIMVASEIPMIRYRYKPHMGNPLLAPSSSLAPSSQGASHALVIMITALGIRN